MNFEDVQRVYRVEKNTPSLTEVPPTFFSDVGVLMQSVEERHAQSLAKFYGEVIGMRRRKILMHALRMEDAESPPRNITPVEDEFYRELVSVLARHKQKLLSQKTVPEPAAAPPKKKEVALERVRVLRALPAIVGSDGASYGPYREGDVAELPAENAGILVKQAAAEETESG